MVARYETHLLIDELQREKMLETQAKQEQVLPVTQEVRSRPETQAHQEQVLPVTPEVRSRPAELKTIYQLKATDRPANVKVMLQERAYELLDELLDTEDETIRLRKATSDDVTQLIGDIDSCQQALDVWKRDVTATATEIVVKFNDLQQEIIALQTR